MVAVLVLSFSRFPKKSVGDAKKVAEESVVGAESAA
jgi:hypothetical protein